MWEELEGAVWGIGTVLLIVLFTPPALYYAKMYINFWFPGVFG